MEQTIETERRWLRSVIKASHEPLPKLVWMRKRGDGDAEGAQDAADRSAGFPTMVPVFSRPSALAAR